ncbi:NUDIX hydrolase [Nocardia miyunensis]|uniref:NUDIX hydrolase n=1 Tax=Nocardia miyunensis TaxID=282684 RepID=UPI00083517BF|nr:NUDIX domain-containing protein [Nocardia miyunensis]
MAISDSDISNTLSAYLASHPQDAAQLSEPMRLLQRGTNFASRRTFPLHVTVGALLVRGDEILLVEHRAYGILLQPGGHLEPHDTSLIGAAVRELTEETGLDPHEISAVSHTPVYIEHGTVPARSEKVEPEHSHLDIGYCFSATAQADIGNIQASEVTSAGWYPLSVAECLVGSRIGRALTVRSIVSQLSSDIPDNRVQ